MGEVGRASVPRIPATIEEAARMISAIGRLKRNLDTLKSGFNREVEKLRVALAREVGPLDEEITALLQGLQAFYDANRKTLTGGNQRKTASFPTGEMGKRFSGKKVVVKDEEEAIASCRALGLEEFLRPRVDLDRQALKKDPERAESIQGVSIVQDEVFWVKPLDLGVEVSRPVKTLTLPA